MPQPACLPPYTANFIHRLSTTKNGATNPPINTRQTEQKLCTDQDKTSPLLPVFCCEWFTSTTFPKSSNQGRTTGYTLFLLACIHPVTSCKAGWIFHPSTSSGSSKGSFRRPQYCVHLQKTHASDADVCGKLEKFLIHEKKLPS